MFDILADDVLLKATFFRRIQSCLWRDSHPAYMYKGKGKMRLKKSNHLMFAPCLILCRVVAVPLWTSAAARKTIKNGSKGVVIEHVRHLRIRKKKGGDIRMMMN